MSGIEYSSTNIKNIRASEVKAKWDVRGSRILRYYVDFSHVILNLHRELSATDLNLLQNKVAVLLAGWDEKYAEYLKAQNQLSGKALADQMTASAEEKRTQFRSLLRYTLSIDDSIDWDILKDKANFISKPFPDSMPPRSRLEHADAPPPKHPRSASSKSCSASARELKVIMSSRSVVMRSISLN